MMLFPEQKCCQNLLRRAYITRESLVRASASSFFDVKMETNRQTKIQLDL